MSIINHLLSPSSHTLMLILYQYQTTYIPQPLSIIIYREKRSHNITQVNFTSNTNPSGHAGWVKNPFPITRVSHIHLMLMHCIYLRLFSSIESDSLNMDNTYNFQLNDHHHQPVWDKSDFMSLNPIRKVFTRVISVN